MAMLDLDNLHTTKTKDTAKDIQTMRPITKTKASVTTTLFTWDNQSETNIDQNASNLRTS